MEYPGHLVRMGEPDGAVVRALKQQLIHALAPTDAGAKALDPADGRFDAATKRAVQLFQLRHVDVQGQPLKPDGEVGPISWSALFASDQPAPPAPVPDAADPLSMGALGRAGRCADQRIREQPRNSNRGPEVEQFQARVGIAPGLAWCCAFTYWCFDEAATGLHLPNPVVKTGGCQDHWNRAAAKGARRITAGDALANPTLIRPGMLFIMAFGSSAGHTGFVESVSGGYLHTVEGNTDASGTREGGGVYRLSRKLKDINKGFIDYASPR